jgi:hypothetical protein
MATDSRHQPAYNILRERGWSVPAAATEIGENLSHLRAALNGRVPPCDRLRRTLPEFLKLPLADLFTSDLLARQYGSRAPKSGDGPKQMPKLGPRRPKSPSTD